MSRYRFLGVTDEQITCDACGRTELRSTVALMPLDAEGNDGASGPTYYGSSCAARALGRTGGKAAAKVLDEARAAQRRLASEARDALEFLAYVGVSVRGVPMFVRNGKPKWGPAARRYNAANPGAIRGLHGGDLTGPVREAVARKVALVRDGMRMGVIAP